MEMSELHLLAQGIIEGSALLLAFLVIIGVLTILVMYLVDITQTEQTIRRNYPVVGRFRYFFEHLGEFFRQYFFALDREELPFNRAERSWVYRAAKQVDSTVAFFLDASAGSGRRHHLPEQRIPDPRTRRGGAPTSNRRRRKLREALHHLLHSQHFRDELRRNFKARGYRAGRRRG